MPSRRAPRVNRLMIDLFHALYDCAHLVAYWDVVGRHDGVLVRVRSRRKYPTEPAAAEAAQVIAASLRPHGYDVREVCAGARTDGKDESTWHAFVELLVS